ncbi:MAG: acylneuraminate cytidylyltransferase family protein [Candidatus Omnitrophota bacterium]|jgi:CMP-N-acetylneuraminic acid synthetase
MKTEVLLPAKLKSDRVPFKNIKNLGGVPLVNYTLRTLNKVSGVKAINLFASEPSICEYIQKGLKYQFVKRPDSLDTQQTTIQDIVREFLKVSDAETIVLFHITSPFVRPQTVAECIDKVNSGKHDSAFTAYEIKKFCWFQGKPLNYTLNQETPRTQDIKPVVVEQSSLYVFKREVFEKTGQRIGSNPYIKFIDHFEGHDIDTPEDFRVAELIVDTGLFTF